MDAMLTEALAMADQNRDISAAVRREGRRLRNFIRRRVLDAAEAEDILQDVLYELVAAHRLMQPIEQAGAWLIRVARNRSFRKRKSGHRPAQRVDDELDGAALDDFLPSLELGPEGETIRRLLLERIEDALDELPPEQRAVFVAHELEGASFKELAERWDVSVNTLLSRKRYAVRALREQLQGAYDEWLNE
jgi:RNA polymerase sigma factor (sigma-70 family)